MIVDWDDEPYIEPYGGGAVPEHHLDGYRYFPRCEVRKCTEKSYLVTINDKTFWCPKKAIAGPLRGVDTEFIYIANWFLCRYLHDRRNK